MSFIFVIIGIVNTYGMKIERLGYNEGDLLDPHMTKKKELIRIVKNNRYYLLRNFGLGGLGFGIATELVSQNFKETDPKIVSWLNQREGLVLTAATVAGRAFGAGMTTPHYLLLRGESKSD